MAEPLFYTQDKIPAQPADYLIVGADFVKPAVEVITAYIAEKAGDLKSRGAALKEVGVQVPDIPLSGETMEVFKSAAAKPLEAYSLNFNGVPAYAIRSSETRFYFSRSEQIVLSEAGIKALLARQTDLSKPDVIAQYAKHADYLKPKPSGTDGTEPSRGPPRRDDPTEKLRS